MLKTGFWQGLCDVEGCGGFKEGALSVSELVQGLLADSGPLDRGEADALSAPIAQEELATMVAAVLSAQAEVWPHGGPQA